MSYVEWIDKNYAIEQVPLVETTCAECKKNILASANAIRLKSTRGIK